jgi:GNAT superfamily N-acetyltransferase
MPNPATDQSVRVNTSVDIIECKTKAERRQFIDFQWEIYKGDPYWVPPLISEREAFYDSTKNPFFEHSQVAMFLAKRAGKVVGTISAILNNRHNQVYQEKTGFFGSFEVINDYEVAQVLLNTARDWVIAKGMNKLRGPATFSANEEYGLLIEGFDSEPQIMMTYNPRYYVDFIDRYGFKKVMDLYAWWGPTDRAAKALIGERFERVVKQVLQRNKFTIRKADLHRFDEEVQRIKQIYNVAWQANWGFVPMTEKEIDHLGENLRQIVDTDFVYIAEKDGEPVGVCISLPNVNHPLRLAYPNPKTPEVWTLLKYLWYRRRTVNSFRLIILGVLPQYRMSGIDAAMIYKTLQTTMEKKYIGGEFSWILETNDAMNRIIQLANPDLYKKYRMYDLALDTPIS